MASCGGSMMSLQSYNYLQDLGDLEACASALIVYIRGPPGM